MKIANFSTYLSSELFFLDSSDSFVSSGVGGCSMLRISLNMSPIFNNFSKNASPKLKLFINTESRSWRCFETSAGFYNSTAGKCKKPTSQRAFVDKQKSEE
jgi:hypothetical protein